MKKLLGVILKHKSCLNDIVWSGFTEESRNLMKTDIEQRLRHFYGDTHYGNLTDDIESDVIIDKVGIYVDSNNNKFFVPKIDDKIMVYAFNLINNSTQNDLAFFYVNGQPALDSESSTIIKYLGDDNV